MDLTKSMNYEISLWEDILGSNGITESKICVLGSNNFRSRISIFEPVLTKKLDGANTLTFSIFAKYRDEETGKLENNPFIPYL
jgi:hypothetical protein